MTSTGGLIFRPVKESERNSDKTVFLGNLDERVDEALLYELMIQAGPVSNVYIPRDRVNQEHQGFGFAEFRTEKDAEYAALIFNQIRLYNKQLRVQKASADKEKDVDIGAELFIGNLDPLVDANVLAETFSVFGTLTKPPRLARDERGKSRKFGFVTFDNFESSDKAITAMNGQYLMNSQITVDYAFKEKGGEGKRHGDEAERALAELAKKNNYKPPLLR